MYGPSLAQSSAPFYGGNSNNKNMLGGKSKRKSSKKTKRSGKKMRKTSKKSRRSSRGKK
jgi:hypothetical protein